MENIDRQTDEESDIQWTEGYTNTPHYCVEGYINATAGSPFHNSHLPITANFIISQNAALPYF